MHPVVQPFVAFTSFCLPRSSPHHLPVSGMDQDNGRVCRAHPAPLPVGFFFLLNEQYIGGAPGTHRPGPLAPPGRQVEMCLKYFLLRGGAVLPPPLGRETHFLIKHVQLFNSQGLDHLRLGELICGNGQTSMLKFHQCSHGKSPLVSSSQPSCLLPSM